ncbi:DUF3325 domain-containing protein [Diaphorobacter ruginosibacter]|uniref:DUF3325 domain-containing protein n=1 Tax=Diaphorobacter ruginosibacter TaxID=1715720 RepID=A0A7G9RRX6_9BURK|nr:DUF3325 domain-containing protein [Diaphorobacter ruginosibacter]QNN58351.1 DUF3325 domain-containing protein [Diaphorobacter ruginosibacter]
MSIVHAALTALALAFTGMCALAFAMDRHHEQLTGQRSIAPWRAGWLRCAGAALLVLCALPALVVWGGSVGTVAWIGFMGAGALLAVVGISLHARWAWRVALVVLVASTLSLVCLAWV